MLVPFACEQESPLGDRYAVKIPIGDRLSGELFLCRYLYRLSCTGRGLRIKLCGFHNNNLVARSQKDVVESFLGHQITMTFIFDQIPMCCSFHQKEHDIKERGVRFHRDVELRGR